MSKTQLSSSEIQDLINRYDSELKKLEFQVNDIRATKDGLEDLLNSVTGREKTAISRVKPKKTLVRVKTIKAKATVSDTPKRKRDRPKKVKTVVVKTPKTKPVKKKENKGYKLSSWDQYVIESLKQAGEVRVTQEIIDFVKAKTITAGLNASDDLIKNKVIRSLQKLANRRGDLKKVNYKGKGFAYALPGWFDAKDKLNKNNKR